MTDIVKYKLLCPHYLKGKYWEEGDIVTNNDFDGKPSAKMMKISGGDEVEDEGEETQLAQATVEDLVDAARTINEEKTPENFTPKGLVKKSAMAAVLNKQIPNDVYQRWKKL